MKGVRSRRPSAKLLIAAVALVALSTVTGFVAGHSVRSPAQVVADTAPPARTTLTEPVTVRGVTQSVALDARVEAKYVTEVSAPSADGTGSGVVTRLPVKPNIEVKSGALIAEVSGRPVMVLQGELPSYRVLGPGAAGPDVKQLQKALTKTGYKIWDQTGTYGASTSIAVDALYRDHGYDATHVGAEEVTGAEDTVRSAQRTLTQAKANKTSGLELRYAKEDLGRAQQQLASAKAKSGAQVGTGEIVFVPALPATVTTVSATVGSMPGESLVTLSSGPLVARGVLNAADATKVRKDDRAQLLLSPGGDAEGTVTKVDLISDQATDKEQPAGGTNQRTVTVVPSKSLKDASRGQPVRVVVAVARSKKDTLAVPISAVSSSGSGATTITVLRGRKRVTVKVTTGFAGDGYVQIEPTSANKLSAGDQVVTGIGVG